MTSLTSPDESLGALTGSLMSLSLDTSLGSAPPRGYPLALLDADDKKYQCGQCHLILRQPMQSYCGHRFCKSCVIYLIRTSAVTCPMCVEEGVDAGEIGTLTVEQTYPDNAIKREFSRMKVRCPYTGCTWAGSFKEFEVHYESCEFLLLACNLCNMEVLRTEMTSHQFTVHNIGADCPFGCEQKIDVSKTVAHMQQYCRQHFEVIMRRVQNLEQLIEGQRGIVSDENLPSQPGLGEKLMRLELAVKKLQDEVRNLRIAEQHSQLGENVVRQQPPPIAELTVIKEQLTIHEAIITVLSREIERLSIQLESQESKRRQNREKIEAVERKTKSIEQALLSKDSVVTEMDLRLTSMELTSFDGELLWKVSDFQRRRQESESQRTPSINSPAFYTSSTGYKMCARLYLNGDGTGRDSHVSLYFVIMRGQYDALLKWPFSRKVTLTIFDQESGRESVTDSFRPDPTSSSFKRPTTDVNVASGCPRFILITQLMNTTCNFVKDNAIFIKIAVESDN